MTGFAMPNDDDLDLDLDGIHIDSVVRSAAEFIVIGSGGSGRWANQDGRMVDVAVVDELELTFGFADPRCSDDIAARLDRWRDSKTPLRMVAAPGRDSLLTDGSEVLIVPRDVP